MSEEGKKCRSWIIVNGEEIKCQWEQKHLGCHSGYATFSGKVKWEIVSGDKECGREEA